MATPHSDIELQAARRHFFDGIATNCLNNSKSAPLSPSSSPLRTASSSPLIAVFNLAFGKKAVLPWATKSASRFCHARQRFHRASLAYSARLLMGCSLRSVVRWEVFADSSRWNTSPAPLNRLLHSRLSFSVLNWRENSEMPA